MTKQKWIIFAVALAMIGNGALMLNRLKTHQRLGRPGIKASPIADSKRLEIYLPEHVLNYDSVTVPVEEAGLPRDTSFGQRNYTAVDNPNDKLQLNVVLMGTDRTSIHKPQFCLKGTGWDIDDTESTEDTVRMTRPYPYELPVMKILTAPRQVLKDGKPETVRGIDVYWFVADDQLTGSHWTRMRSSATHLLRTGELQRWAYVFCFTTCRPGEEKATYEHMCRFLAASVPEFQLTAGPHLAGQNATQTASEKAPALPDGLRN
jgi:hypothetical protein